MPGWSWWPLLQGSRLAESTRFILPTLMWFSPSRSSSRHSTGKDEALEKRIHQRPEGFTTQLYCNNRFIVCRQLLLVHRTTVSESWSAMSHDPFASCRNVMTNNGIYMPPSCPPCILVDDVNSRGGFKAAISDSRTSISCYVGIRDLLCWSEERTSLVAFCCSRTLDWSTDPPG